MTQTQPSLLRISTCSRRSQKSHLVRLVRGRREGKGVGEGGEDAGVRLLGVQRFASYKCL